MFWNIGFGNISMHLFKKIKISACNFDLFDRNVVKNEVKL